MGSDANDDNANDSESGSQHEELLNAQAPVSGDYLVDAPELVPQHNIRYATKAKKMDMKKLKRVIWRSVLSDETHPYETIGEEEMQTGIAKLHAFQGIMQQLPGRLNENMREELSVPLAFMAVLHLANEHELKLTPSGDLKNFMIEQDKKS